MKEKNDGEEGSEKQVFGEENSKEDRKEKINREEGCKEQGFQEDHSEEGKKAKKKVFKEKKSPKEGVHFPRERVRSRERVRKDQMLSIPIDVAFFAFWLIVFCNVISLALLEQFFFADILV